MHARAARSSARSIRERRIRKWTGASTAMNTASPSTLSTWHVISEPIRIVSPRRRFRTSIKLLPDDLRDHSVADRAAIHRPSVRHAGQVEAARRFDTVGADPCRKPCVRCRHSRSGQSCSARAAADCRRASGRRIGPSLAAVGSRCRSAASGPVVWAAGSAVQAQADSARRARGRPARPDAPANL